MAHEIKMDRSRKLAPHVPTAQAEIEASISPMLIERLTAAELAEVRRCLDLHWHKAITHAERDALAEGAIYDPAIGAMREINPHAAALGRAKNPRKGTGSLSPEERKRRASMAARARWGEPSTDAGR